MMELIVLIEVVEGVLYSSDVDLAALGLISSRYEFL